MDDTMQDSGNYEAASLLAAAMPGTPAALAQRLLMEAAEPLGISGDPADGEDDAAKVAAALQMIQAAAPRDALEAMLAAQMAACHAAAMRTLRRAAECTGHPQIEALYARQAARLMTLFIRQTEALQRRHDRDAVARADASQAAMAADAQAERQDAKDRASPPSPTPPPLKGEGFLRRDLDDMALSRPGGGGLAGGGTRQGRAPRVRCNSAAPPPRNGSRHHLNGTAPAR